MPRARTWTVALTFIFVGAAALVAAWGTMSASAQTPTPSPQPCPPVCPIPGSASVPPGGTVTFRSWVPPTPAPDQPRDPAGPQIVRVDNQSDQPATIAYDGRTLTIAVPAGVTLRVQVRTPPSNCTPVDGQPNVIACAPLLGRPPAFVTFTTVGPSASTETLELFPGCNNVSLTWPDGTPTSDVATAVTPASALVAI